MTTRFEWLDEDVEVIEEMDEEEATDMFKISLAYNPDQPRVPAGSGDDSGEWAGGSGGGGGGKSGGGGKGKGKGGKQKTFKKLSSSVEAAEFSKKSLQKLPSTKETESLTIYQSDRFADINQPLRESKFSEFTEKHLANLDSVISKNVISEDVVVYRGLGDGFDANKLSVGDSFMDKGYTSTSMLPDGVAEFNYQTELQIALPKGTNAVPMNTALRGKAERPSERELLLGRNSKFRVVEKIKNGPQTILKCEYIK